MQFVNFFGYMSYFCNFSGISAIVVLFFLTTFGFWLFANCIGDVVGMDGDTGDCVAVFPVALLGVTVMSR